MTFPEFDKFQEELLKEVILMKDTKGKEYANSESRFANFDRLAIRLNLSNIKVALVYLTKHMDAIESYISRGRTYSTETIQGRIVDAITYLTLIAGMIEEQEHKPIVRRNCIPDIDAKKFVDLTQLPLKDANPGTQLPFEYKNHIVPWNFLIFDKPLTLKDANSGKQQPFEYDPTKPTEGYSNSKLTHTDL